MYRICCNSRALTALAAIKHNSNQTSHATTQPSSKLKEAMYLIYAKLNYSNFDLRVKEQHGKQIVEL